MSIFNYQVLFETEIRKNKPIHQDIRYNLYIFLQLEKVSLQSIT